MIQTINSTMKIQFRHPRVFTFLFTLLLLTGVANQAWAYKVTYHILTRKINNSIYHMKDAFSDKRLEAVRVVDANATGETKIGLPAAFKSPLAKNFRYYLSGKVTNSGSAVQMYDYKGTNKCYWYSIANEVDSITTATYPIESNIDVYVTYEYDEDNTIYKLDGSKNYNLSISGGFLAFNRGRNNRIAIIPESSGRVSAEALVSEDFVKVNVSGITGTSISDYWNNNKNPRANVGGQFFFMFQFVGEDPYNILIRTAYNKDYTYIEQHGDDKNLVYKYYKESYLFWPSSDTSGFFLASDDHKQYKDKSTGYDPNPKAISPETNTGYFHGKGGDVVYNSFAILNNTDENGYLFMISRYIDKDGNISEPGDYKSAKYNFLARDGNYNNLKSDSKTLAAASASYSTDRETYLVNSYRFKVKRKCSTAALEKDKVLPADVQVSEYYASSSPLDFVPDALKRKYVTFTGAYKQYEDDNLVTKFNTFAEVDANAVIEDGKKVIWLDYKTDMPFDTWTKENRSDVNGNGAVDFDELKWYNFHVNKNASNSAYWDGDGTKIKTSTGLSKYARASHFAFVGDPYDLTIVGRKASEDVSGTPSTLNYMKLATTITDNATFDVVASATTWGIMYDDNTGDYKDCFRLKDNSGEKYLHRNTTTDNPLNGTENSDEAVRITVVNLPTKPYVYYIRDLGGNIAVKASGNHEPSAKLGYKTIPESIRSPFIEGRTLTFYGSYTEAGGGATTAKSDATAGTPTVTYAKDTEDGAVQHIVVTYDFPSAGNPYYTYINGSTSFNVRLNGEYIYYDSGTNTIMSKASPTEEELDTNPYLWYNGGADPYAMTIKNANANKYVTASTADKSALEWDADVADATKFVIKSGTSPHVYEVMYATGESVDASTTYYNIGRDDTGTKIFQNTTYEHGYDQLRFQLTAQDAHQVTYHLIDKQGKDLLQVVARHSNSDDPLFPNDYRSPLVQSYHYWILSNFDVSDGKYTLKSEQTELLNVGSEAHIYVTYTANNLVDMSGRTLYLLKFAVGDQFRQEDGSDGLLSDPSTFVGTADEKKYRYQAVYPYCNGDCNFNVYGQEQYDIQQQGAASTRTRWAWYVESVNNDPYHIKIFSRQQETYPAGSSNHYNAYFRTYAETYGGSQHVVTTLAWPGISGVQGTEYMVLGSAGQFRLMTTDKIYDGSTTVHRAVNSFEQYWKTWNTIRKVVLGDTNAEAKQSDPNTVPATPATAVATAAGENNRTYLTNEMGWHSYEQWAYAIRWNDYNIKGEKNKKGWEDIEHWYQTVNMGEGYFDFVRTTIDPVLILLDQHGWEVMRKPLPTGPDDPDKSEKYDAIRPYDSPMVKEYAFWSTAKKRLGFHQYYMLSKRIGGEDFTSTSLTDLPPFDSENAKDAKGNLYDQYVTYIVKDEYAQSYDPSNSEAKPFIIQQGTHFAYNNSNAATVGKEDVPATGGMSQYIISNINDLTTSGSRKNELWYVKPNTDIDIEMGYYDESKFPTGYAHNWDAKSPNAYEDKYSSLKAAVYVKETAEYKNGTASERKTLTDTYGEFSFSNGFDPYNIQISSVSNDAKYFVTNASEAHINDGSILGNGTTNTLDGKAKVYSTFKGGMENRTIQMTNATFMAVQDENGNIQLMPRFDHEKRLKDFSALVPTDDEGVAQTYTKLYRPIVYNYKIVDNTGNESLRYQSGGDLVPQTPEWFKSPLAKDFKYYAGISGSTGENEITESLEGAALTDNSVYVRYSYDAEADELSILQGNWLTMQLNNYNMFYDTGTDGYGIYDDTSSSKPEIINAAAKKWQWKFLESPFSEPDPYAVPLYNRNKTDGVAIVGVGAILSHSSGNYALIKARTGSITYQFLKSNGDTSKANTWGDESSFKSASCTFDGTKSQIKLVNDVIHTFNYKIYTNNGDFAVSANQNDVSEDNSPILPEEIRSPLLNKDQFRYYEVLADTAANSGKQIKNLYGLYDDIVYVRYNGYNLKATEYKVPNAKTVIGGDVAKDEANSNDAALDINDELLYNIIWYADNMMKAVDSAPTDGEYDAIDCDASHVLSSSEEHVWKFEGNDPYAIKIKHKNSGKYAVGTGTLAATATSTFMLLPSSDEWQYGVLQVTGGTNKLSGYGQTTVAADPTKFIIFGLSTHKVIYHLVIANIGNKVTIPYRETKGGTLTIKDIDGSTHRDLTTTTTVTGDTYQLGETKSINSNNVNYCVDEGHITLGDPLKVPEALERPNCKYFYYVEGVYTDGACTTPDETLNTQYKGLQIAQMGTEPALLGKTVVINVEYQFDDGLPTNNGSDFVTNTSGTQWFTFETNDETPYLANYTYKGAKLMGIRGRTGHYTNEFLWSPVGDPYGFKMYNRYVYKNGTEDGHANKVMTTTSGPAINADLIMAEDASTSKPVYELLPGETAGYFKVQSLTIPGGTPCYLDNTSGTIKLKASTTTEWTFGLDQSLFDPYYLGAGNVGGLTTTVKEGTSKTKSGKTLYEEATTLIAKQGVVFDADNIVDFTPGYYRIFNQPGSQGITTPRYLSGYTHKTELTSSIPMHFYEKEGEETTFDGLGATGYYKTTATQGQIPIEAPEYDPASIFYISGSGPYTMQTQGLYVDGAVMASAAGTNSNFYVVDVGGAVVLLHDGALPAARNYLHYKQDTYIYDVKFDTGSVIGDDDAAKWCMEPANKKGLWIQTHSGGEEDVLTDVWYYSSYCVPFDLLIADKDGADKDHSSNAYTCVETWKGQQESPWPGTAEEARKGLHPKPIGKYVKDDENYPLALRQRWDSEKKEMVGNDYFVPAGTPVLFSTKRATEYIKATIPTTTPSTRISTIFSYEYLEQVLPGWDNSKRVYVFGPKMEGTLSINSSNGIVDATLPSLGNTNVGFHLNANPNKEAGLSKASWTRNNFYVLHNKIYYLADAPGSARELDMEAPQFVPIIFDGEEGEEELELQPDGSRQTIIGDGCIYDLSGRKVATEQQVQDGSWNTTLAPGIYILNGRKFQKK